MQPTPVRRLTRLSLAGPRAEGIQPKYTAIIDATLSVINGLLGLTLVAVHTYAYTKLPSEEEIDDEVNTTTVLTSDGETKILPSPMHYKKCLREELWFEITMVVMSALHIFASLILLVGVFFSCILTRVPILVTFLILILFSIEDIGDIVKCCIKGDQSGSCIAWTLFPVATALISLPNFTYFLMEAVYKSYSSGPQAKMPQPSPVPSPPVKKSLETTIVSKK